MAWRCWGSCGVRRCVELTDCQGIRRRVERTNRTRVVRAMVLLSAMAVTACALGPPAVAGGTHFGMKPIVIAGSSNVNATALNNKRAIVGTYSIGSATNGFILSGGVLTVLPPTNAG